MIEIFEAAHPGCQGLFIFDQSSTHASLPPDALWAFDMKWFMEAYQAGLTGKAATWAVKKQKQHCMVLERDMVAMENVNTSA